MSKSRLPRRKYSILHSVLEEGTRPIRRPCLRYKDVVKRDLRDFNIEPSTWTSACTDRSAWRTNLHKEINEHIEANIQRLMRRRQRLSATDDVLTDLLSQSRKRLKLAWTELNTLSNTIGFYSLTEKPLPAKRLTISRSTQCPLQPNPSWE